MVRDQPVRSGISNLIANWQIVAIGVLEALAGAHVVVPVGRAVLEPVLAELTDTLLLVPNVPVGGFLTSRGIMTAAAVVAAVVLLLLALMAHSLIMGGNAYVYLAGEQKASARDADVSEVRAYRAFDLREWWRAGRSSMWRVAGVYGAVTGLVVLIVGVMLALAALAAPGSGRSGGFMCLAIAVAFPLVFAAAVGTAICVPKAVALVVGRSLATREALQLALAQSIGSLGDHLRAVIVVGFFSGVANAVISGTKSVATLLGPERLWSEMFVASARLAVSGAEGLVTVLTAFWLLATLTALTEMPEVPSP